MDFLIDFGSNLSVICTAENRPFEVALAYDVARSDGGRAWGGMEEFPADVSPKAVAVRNGVTSSLLHLMFASKDGSVPLAKKKGIQRYTRLSACYLNMLSENHVI